MRRLGHMAARLAHPLRHCGNAGIDPLQLGLLIVVQVEPGASDQKLERLVCDFGHHVVLSC